VAAFEGLSKWNPEKAARELRDLKRAGLPEDYEASFDPVFVQEQITLREMLDQASEPLAKHLGNPRKAAAMWDDIPKINAVEKTLGVTFSADSSYGFYYGFYAPEDQRVRDALESVKRVAGFMDQTEGPLYASDWERLGIAFDAGRAAAVANELSAQAAMARFGGADPLTPEQEAELERARKAANQSPGKIGGFAGFLAPAVSSAPAMWDVYGAGVKYAGAGAAAGMTVGAARAAITNLIPGFGEVATLGSALTQAAWGARVGFLAGTAKGSFIQEAGESREQYRRLIVDGKPLPEEYVDAGAIIAGGFSAAEEMLGAKVLTDVLSGVATRTIGKHLFRKVVEDALRDPTMREVLLRGAREYRNVVLAEGGTEALQEWTKSTIGELLKWYSSREQDGEYSLGDAIAASVSPEALAATLHAGVQGTQAAMVFVAPVSVVSVSAEAMMLDREAQDGHRRIDKILELARSMKFAKTNPGLRREVLNDVGRAKGVKYYLDPRDAKRVVDELYQTGKDENTVPWMAALQEKIKEAEAEQKDIELDVGDAVDIMLGPEGERIRAHVRPGKDTPSQSEIEMFQEEFRTRVSQEIERAMKNVRVLEEAKAIYDEHLQAIEDAGIATPAAAKKLAHVVPAWMAAKARQLGVSVREVADSLDLDIVGPALSRVARVAKMPDSVFTGRNARAVKAALESGELNAEVRDLGLVKKPKKKGEDPTLDARLARAWLREYAYRKGKVAEQSGGRGSFNPNTLTMYFTHAADLTTFLRESAHFILEAETRLAGGMMGPLRGLEEKIAEYTGLSAADVYRVVAGASDDPKTFRAVHEWFATEFEKFLYSGEAPSAALRDTFRSARQWMLYVYKDTPEFLTDEVKAEASELFDQLLAIDTAVEEQVALSRYRSIANEVVGRVLKRKEAREEKRKAAEQARMDKAGGDPELADWMAAQEAKDRLVRRWYKTLKKQYTKEWRDKKQSIMKRWIPKLRDEKRHRLRESMRSQNGVKLDRKAVKEILGVKRIPKRLYNMTVAKDGMHPDALAELAQLEGVKTGEQLVRMLAMMDDPETEAARLAEAELKAIYGDLTDPKRLQKEAEELTSQAHSDKILKEFLRLNKATGKRTPDVQAIKAAVKERLVNLKVSDLTPGEYRAAEIRAARLQGAAEARGDMEDAAHWAEIRLVNHYLFNEATAYKKEVQKAWGKLNKFKKESYREKVIRAGEGYWERIAVMLTRVGIDVPESELAVELFTKWVNEKTGDVQPPDVVIAGKTTPFKELTVGQALAVYDSVMSLRHAALNVNKIRLADKDRDFAETKETLLSAIHRNRIDKKSNKQVARDKSQRLHEQGRDRGKRLFRELRASLAGSPWLAMRLQGHKRAGPVTEILDRPKTEALEAEHEMSKWSVMKFAELLANRDREQLKKHNTLHPIQSLAAATGGKHTHLRGDQLIAAVLNMGTQENLDKLLKGYGLIAKDETATLDHPFVKEVLSLLDEKDWTIVKETWAIYRELFPLMQEVVMRTKGARLKKKQEMEITHPVTGEVIKGGYAPIDYDYRMLAQESSAKAQQAVDQMFDGLGFRDPLLHPDATHGVTNFVGPLNLDLNVMIDTMTDVVHYITHYETIHGLNRLLSDHEVENAINQAEGYDMLQALKENLVDVAGGNRRTPSAVEKLSAHVRHGFTLAVLWGSVRGMLSQTLGLVNSVGELSDGRIGVGEKRLIKAIIEILSDPVETVRWVNEKSAVMPYRMQTRDREIKFAREQARGQSGRKAKWNYLGMLGYGLFQTYSVDLPTWVAAYRSHIEKASSKKSPEEIEQEAIAYADSAVERVQGSGEAKNLPSVAQKQRPESMRWLTLFGTAFLSFYNALEDAAVGAARGKYTVGEAAVRVFYAGIAPSIISVLVAEVWSALMRDDGSDDDKMLWEKFILEEMGYLSRMIPLGGAVYSGAVYNMGGDMPLYGIAADLGASGKKLVSLAFGGDEEFTKRDMRNLAIAASAIFHVGGAAQISRTVEGIDATITEAAAGNLDQTTIDKLLFGVKK